MKSGSERIFTQHDDVMLSSDQKTSRHINADKKTVECPQVGIFDAEFFADSLISQDGASNERMMYLRKENLTFLKNCLWITLRTCWCRDEENC